MACSHDDAGAQRAVLLAPRRDPAEVGAAPPERHRGPRALAALGLGHRRRPRLRRLAGSSRGRSLAGLGRLGLARLLLLAQQRLRRGLDRLHLELFQQRALTRNFNLGYNNLIF